MGDECVHERSRLSDKIILTLSYGPSEIMHQKHHAVYFTLIWCILSLTKYETTLAGSADCNFLLCDPWTIRPSNKFCNMYSDLSVVKICLTSDQSDSLIQFPHIVRHLPLCLFSFMHGHSNSWITMRMLNISVKLGQFNSLWHVYKHTLFFYALWISFLRVLCWKNTYIMYSVDSTVSINNNRQVLRQNCFFGGKVTLTDGTCRRTVKTRPGQSK